MYALDAKAAIFRSERRLLPALAAILIPESVLSKKSAMVSRPASELISLWFFALAGCGKFRESAASVFVCFIFQDVRRFFGRFFRAAVPQVGFGAPFRDTTTWAYCAGTVAAIRFRMRTRL